MPCATDGSPGPAARVPEFSAGTGGGKKPETLRRLVSISCF